MHIRLTFLFCCIFITTNSFAQESTIIHGTIINANQVINNVHIINLNSGRGTISNDNGSFEIKTKVNDTLLFSSIQFEKIKIAVTKNHLNSKIMEVHLITYITNLDEVFLHNLTGNLNLDITKKHKDTIPKHNFIFKLSDLDKNLPPDIKGPKKAPFVGPFKPLPAAATIPDFYLIALRKLKRELKIKKGFPYKIKKDLGISYFTTNLKIPEEKINHFLTYCEYKNIIEEYNKNNLLEVIKILRKESLTYNEIKN
tara:strand:+ start:31045 stop:31809 length:765 start_codon:yes stop_codon:yes gene_type:complete